MTAAPLAGAVSARHHYQMDIAGATRLLRRAARIPRLQLSITRRGTGFERSFCDELYTLSSSLSSETRAHFQLHTDTNDEIHVLRDEASGTLCGFQMWRFGGVAGPDVPIRWGGKLRFVTEIRRHGLHLLLNLVSLRSAKEKLGEAVQIHRIALVNLFGYQAIRPALASAFSPPFALGASASARVSMLTPEFEPFCQDIGFQMDPRTNRVNVGQTLPRRP